MGLQNPLHASPTTSLVFLAVLGLLVVSQMLKYPVEFMIFFAIAFVAVAVGIPWRFRSAHQAWYDRPVEDEAAA